MSTKLARIAATAATLTAVTLGLNACSATPAPTTPAASTQAPASSQAPAASETPATSQPTAASETPTSAPAQSSEAPTKPATEAPVVAGTPDPADGKPGAAACYDDKGENRTTATSDAVVKADGLVAAWLCGDAPGGYGSVGPVEPLVTDLPGLVADFDKLAPFSGEMPQAVGSIYRVVLQYADGTFTVIEGDDQDGAPITQGTAQKAGGDSFFSDVKGRWLDQRVANGAFELGAMSEQMATCPAAPDFLMPAPLTDVSGGWACAGGSEVLTKRVLDPELAKAIAAVLETQSTPVAQGLGTSAESISLMTPFGEAITLQRLDDNSGWQWTGDSGISIFKPGSNLAKSIDQALHSV